MTDAHANRPPPGPPPTIGYLRAQGVTQFRVSCNGSNCHHGADMKLDALGLADDTPFPSIATRRRQVRIAAGKRHAALAVWVRRSSSFRNVSHRW